MKMSNDGKVNILTRLNLKLLKRYLSIVYLPNRLAQLHS